MNIDDVIKQIKKAAIRDDRNRKDIRYKRAMAFLEKKGFLKTNMDFKKNYLARIRIKDLIWAGKHVEPRILEVLPAAVARLPKAFIHDTTADTKRLLKVVAELNRGANVGCEFLNIPYKKLKVWMHLPLNDGRTRTLGDKKIMRTFRLKPETIHKIALLKEKNDLSEAGMIERLVHEAVL